MSASNILIILTGSIAAYKACEVISQLVQRGHTVQTVATPAALKFVGAATLEGLTGRRVHSDLFAAGEAMAHIDLTRWADLVLVCPVTANTINHLAAGLGGDLVGNLFLAHDRRKPWLMAPAMNPAMWSHPATESAVDRLTEWGVRFLPVEKGRTACGEIGDGRLIPPVEIVAAVEAALANPARRLRVLITGGGTSEPVDGVRVLGNTSTGRTSALLAEGLIRLGHEVILLRARNAQRPAIACREEIFSSFAELEAALNQLLSVERFDAIIHAAAVSDFGVAALQVDGARLLPGAGKISSGSSLALHLKPQPKLVDGLRARSATPLKVIAFKLTQGADEQEAAAAVRKLFAHSSADWVVYNDLDAKGISPDDFPFTIFRPDFTVAVRGEKRSALAGSIEHLLLPANPLSP